VGAGVTEMSGVGEMSRVKRRVAVIDALLSPVKVMALEAGSRISKTA
jgi:hypothetical protein